MKSGTKVKIKDNHPDGRLKGLTGKVFNTELDYIRVLIPNVPELYADLHDSDNGLLFFEGELEVLN